MTKHHRGEVHTAEEWEAIKEPFLALYKENTLDKTISIIAETYNFHANARQYKFRIRQWKANKSGRAGAGACLSGGQSRAPPRTVPDGDPDDDPDGDPRAPDDKTQQPDCHPYHYPSPTTSAESLTPTRTLSRSPESPSGELRTIHLISVAVHTAFQRARSLSVAPAVTFGSLSHRAAQDPSEPAAALVQFYVRAQTMSALMALPSFPRRRLFMSRLNTEVQNFVNLLIDDANPTPLQVTCMLQVCCRFWQNNQLPVLGILLRYVSKRAAATAPGHPLHLLCDALLQCLDLIPSVAVFAANRAVDASLHFFTPSHPQALSARRGLCTALLCSGDTSGALQVSAACLDNERDSERPSSEAKLMWRTEALARLVRCEVATNQLGAAEAHLAELFDSLENIRNTTGGVPWSMWYMSLALRGELLRLQGHPAALDVLREACAIARSNCQLMNWWYLYYAQNHLRFAQDPRNERKPFSLPI